MDFNISEKMKTILAMIDEFVDKELIPLEKVKLTPGESMVVYLPTTTRIRAFWRGNDK